MSGAQLIEQMQGIRTLVVGDAMLDRYWTGTVDRVSPEAPVPVVKVQEIDERAGGAGNVAVNIASLGASCRLLSFVGDDKAGRQLNAILGQAGVDRHLHIDPESRTTEKLRIVSRNQQLLRADFESQPSLDLLARSTSDFKELVPEIDVVVISDYAKGGLTHVAELISVSTDRGIPVLVDPKGTDFGRYRGATIVTPNRDEFEAVTGVSTRDPEFDNAARQLVIDSDLTGLLVTQGGDGMALFLSTGQVIRQSARALEVFDVSGAGDTVVAIMAVALGLKLPWEKCLEMATRGASAVVGRFGTSVVHPTDLESSGPGSP